MKSTTSIATITTTFITTTIIKVLNKQELLQLTTDELTGIWDQCWIAMQLLGDDMSSDWQCDLAFCEGRAGPHLLLLFREVQTPRIGDVVDTFHCCSNSYQARIEGVPGAFDFSATKMLASKPFGIGRQVLRASSQHSLREPQTVTWDVSLRPAVRSVELGNISPVWPPSVTRSKGCSATLGCRSGPYPTVPCCSRPAGCDVGSPIAVGVHFWVPLPAASSAAAGAAAAGASCILCFSLLSEKYGQGFCLIL